MTHTPGPWIGGLQISSSLGTNIIAHIQTRATKLRGYSNTNGVKHYEALANARLITAAPELLAALQSLVELLADDESHMIPEEHVMIGNAREAIAKATGEEP